MFRTLFNMHFTIIRFCSFWLSHFANHLFSVSFQSPEAAKAPAAAVEGPMTPHPPALQGLGLNPWDFSALLSPGDPGTVGPGWKMWKSCEKKEISAAKPRGFQVERWLARCWKKLGLEQQREGFHPRMPWHVSFLWLHHPILGSRICHGNLTTW